MGKFDGILLVSDFDNTLLYTEDVLLHGGAFPSISQENREAIEYFMAQGGTFSVATGRALPSFSPLAKDLPMNGPSILFNGAAIYDFARGEYLCTAFLPDSIRQTLLTVEQAFPGLTAEIYHDTEEIHLLHPNEFTRNHLRHTKSPTIEIDSILEAPTPISNVLLEDTGPRTEKMEQYIRSQPWAQDFEIIKPGQYYLEITNKGANKGGMVQRLAELLHIPRENVCCVGDHFNDIPMLQFAGHPFAPANAIDPVRALPGVTMLPSCKENAVAALIRHLDGLFPESQG